MAKIPDFNGPNWRDDPLENTPPVRCGDSFLAWRRANPSVGSEKARMRDGAEKQSERKSWPGQTSRDVT